MTKIFSVDYRKGSFIDSVNKIVGVPTSLSKLIRTDKGTALARVVNHDGVTYTTGSKSLSKFTIVAWIKQRTTDTGDRYGTAYIDSTQIIRRDNSATNYSNYFDGGTKGSLSVPTSTSLNKWMQFVVTCDGANLISSVNNKQLVGSPSATTGTLDYTSIIIGRNTTTSRYSDSDILKFEVYDDVISDKELELDYKALLESQVTEKPIRGFELVKPTDLSYLKDDKVGINLTDNYDFDTWTSTGTAFESKTSNSFTTNGSGGGVSRSALLTIGIKYRMTIRGTTTSGFTVTNTAVSPTYATFGVGDFSSTIDFTATTANTIYLRNLLTGTTTITHLSIQKVTGLVAAYNMIPSNGTLVDISGNGNSGVINGAISTKDGLKFDGVDDYVGISDTTQTNTAISFRFKTSSASRMAFCSGFLDDYCIFMEGGLIGTGNGINNGTTNTFNDGLWHSVVINRTGTLTYEIYVDGILQTLQDDASWRVSSKVIIGQTYVTGYSLPFDGELSDMRVYNYALTPQQAKDYHNSFIKPIILEDWSGSAVGDVI